MITYILRRLLWLPVLLLAVSLVTFALGLYGPGDPVQVLVGQRANPELVERIKHEWGLDRPFPVQYAGYVWRALHGDLGESLVKYRGQPVSRLIGQGLLVTAQLNLISIALGIVVGIPLGIAAALRQGSWIDHLARIIVVGGISVPGFVIAPILMFIFARQLRILPPGGWDGIFSTKIVMPAIVLGKGPIAVFVRQMRANMLEVLPKDYIYTARAKGLPERMVILGHALKNALIPVFTILGLMLGGLVEGSFITETIFGIPGIGRLGFEAFWARDYPIIMALTLLVAVAYALANLAVDIGYGFLDPRIRYT
ncbi:MAG: ABC transporter permease [Chloroflexota bacterium]|nr:ABC transporter permease [Chloroflexota bacterium]